MKFLTKKSGLDADVDIVFVGRSKPLRAAAKNKWLDGKEQKHLDQILSKDPPANQAASADVRSFSRDDIEKNILAVVLPDEVSQSNSTSAASYLDDAADKLPSSVWKKGLFVLCCEKDEHLQPYLTVLARCERRYDRTKDAKPRKIQILALNKKGEALKISSFDKQLVDSVAQAACLVDTPTQELGPEDFAKYIKDRFKGAEGVKVKEYKGDQLLKMGLGGMHAVGRCAAQAPRMVVIEYRPEHAKKKAPHVMLVGKGVMYDTGGLNLKISGAMSGMKGDMGGSAAVVEATYLLAKSGCDRPITAIVGLVENAIGRDAYRPDDILTMHSGLTVEINNTDAEGRLVLADAQSYGHATYKPDLAIEAATLTGAQLVATGLKHAAVMSNSHAMERFAVDTGKATGDLLYALPFGAEFHAREFVSPVADLRNSVKNRMNASSSAAAYFVYAHVKDKAKDWIHIDIAGPSFVGDRGTGFGVHILSKLSMDYQR